MLVVVNFLIDDGTLVIIWI